MRCQHAVVAGADGFLARRRMALGRCLAKAWRCPAAMDARATAADDRCLASVAARCAAAVARARRGGDALLRCAAAPPAGIGVASDALLSDDGLGFDALGPYCPALTAGPDSPAAAAICQQVALACADDAALQASVPRAAELLGRLGVSGDFGSGCSVPAACGNGIIEGGEECDDGAANSDAAPDACRSTCREPACGDGVVDSDEECDDGNLVDGDGCASDCTLPGDGGCDGGDCADSGSVCGNGIVEDDEECDDGAANSDVVPDRCRSDCTRPYCGDGVVDPGAGETCEPPGTLLCDADCRFWLPLPPLVAALGRAGAAPDGLVRCQEDIRRNGARLFGRAVTRLGRCVMMLEACALRDAPDMCVDRAARSCAAFVRTRDSLLAAALAPAAGSCGDAAPEPLAALLDPVSGLGFATEAATCAFAGDHAPGLEDLLACVYRGVECRAESAVLRTVPRAYDLLDDAGLDPDDAFPCLTDGES